METLFEAEKYLQDLQFVDRKNYLLQIEIDDFLVLQQAIEIELVNDEQDLLLSGIQAGIFQNGSLDYMPTVFLSRREVGYLTSVLERAIEGKYMSFSLHQIGSTIHHLNDSFFNAGGKLPEEYLEYLKRAAR